jgi:hypothetical protein
LGEFLAKIQPEKCDSNLLYKGFFMEKIAPNLSIFERKKLQIAMLL